MVVSQKDAGLCAQRKPSGTFIAIWPKGSRHRGGFRHALVCPFGRRADRWPKSVCPPRRRRVPLRARRSHPRKQQTSTWEQSGGSLPAPPPPTEAQVTTGEEAHRTGLREGFPNAGAGTSRRPQGGLPEQPEEGGRVQWGDATAERVPSPRPFVLVN